MSSLMAIESKAIFDGRIIVALPPTFIFHTASSMPGTISFAPAINCRGSLPKLVSINKIIQIIMD